MRLGSDFLRHNATSIADRMAFVDKGYFGGEWLLAMIFLSLESVSFCDDERLEVGLNASTTVEPAQTSRENCDQ